MNKVCKWHMKDMLLLEKDFFLNLIEHRFIMSSRFTGYDVLFAVMCFHLQSKRIIHSLVKSLWPINDSPQYILWFSYILRNSH